MAILIKFEDRPYLHEDRGFALDGKIWNPAFQIDRLIARSARIVHRVSRSADPRSAIRDPG
jgi:hypothetical protein